MAEQAYEISEGRIDALTLRLIAFASIFPIVTVMSYAILMERVAHWRERQS